MDTSQPQGKRDEPQEWVAHENISEAAQKAARELLEETGGSLDLAQHALEQEARRCDQRGEGEKREENRDHFAHQLGFESYRQLQAASPSVNADDRLRWHVTQVTTDQQKYWTAWNEQELNAPGRFASEQEAAASITDGPGSRTNGARRGG